MRILFYLYLTFACFLVHAQTPMEKSSEGLSAVVKGSSSISTEKYIQLSKRKLALELENRKLRELLGSSEERIKQLLTDQKEMEKELVSLEKELATSEKQRDAIEDKNTQLQAALEEISTHLKKILPQK